MRKILLSTTAMTGASLPISGTALAAEKPKLEISGYLRFEAWSVDQDKFSGVNNQGVAFSMDDAEIHFDGSAKADNGLEYGFHIELQEGEGDGQAGYDVAHAFLAGGWGRLELGSTPGAEDNLKVGAVSIMADLDGAWDGELPFNAADTTAYIGSNMVGNTGDANKISYYTPEFSGFSAAVSYAPDSEAALSGGFRAETNDPVNVVEVAAKYAATFNDVDVEVSARGVTGVYGANDTGDATTERESIRAWGVGAMAAHKGFEVAGSYTDNSNSGVTTDDKANGADAGGWWDLGVAYGSGPYKVSVACMRSWAARPNGVEDDTVDYLSVGGLYAAAPGLDLYATYQYVDLDRAGTANDNQANLFMVGTQVSF
jgi:predicted porin